MKYKLEEYNYVEINGVGQTVERDVWLLIKYLEKKLKKAEVEVEKD